MKHLANFQDSFHDLGHVDRRRVLQSIAAAALPTVLGSAGAATGWPQKPLRLIVGFPPGSSPDAIARTISEPLSQALGQAVIVENKVGAGGSIGVDAVAKATDGHTIGLTGNGPLTTAKLLNPKLSFDVARDLRPISLVASSPFMLVGKMSIPATDLPGLIAYARSQGDRLSYGSVGVGSGGHLGMELLKSLTGIRAVHIPFPGNPQVVTAIMAGDIDLSLAIPSIVVPQAKNGRLRIFGVSTASRAAAFSDVPSIGQSLKLPGFDVDAWNAIFAPASMPEAIAARLSQEISRILKSPDIRQRLFDQGWKSLGTSPEGLANRIKDDTLLWAGIIRSTNTRGE